LLWGEDGLFGWTDILQSCKWRRKVAGKDKFGVQGKRKPLWGGEVKSVSSVLWERENMGNNMLKFSFIKEKIRLALHSTLLYVSIHRIYGEIGRCYGTKRIKSDTNNVSIKQ